MSKQPDSLVLKLLRSIRTEQASMRTEIAGLRAETSLKIGTLAESMVGMRKDINSLESAVQGIRVDVRMIALAVDEHTRRLDRIEAHYNQ